MNLYWFYIRDIYFLNFSGLCDDNNQGKYQSEYLKVHYCSYSKIAIKYTNGCAVFFK